ncbi:MAG: PDZ domain-containing protein [Lentisphaerae bacterium]|nr:PDZ domain-containing protein [Lentisphaerota bacterium]
MRIKHSLLLIAIALSGYLVRGLDAQEQSTAEMIRRNNAMLEKYAHSIVEVEYFFNIEKQSEVPGLQVRYLCPHCKNYHYEGLESLISRRRSQGVPGFVVGADRILSVDMHLRLDWLERIEVICDGQRLPAKITRYYPQNKAVELQVSGLESTRLQPISFTGQSQGRHSYFFLVKEKGIRIAGCRPDSSESIRKNLDSGIDYREMLPNSLVLDSRGEAVTLSFQERVTLTQERFAPPQHWANIDSATREQQLMDLQSHLTQNLFPVTFFLEEEKNSEPRHYRRYREREDDNEFLTVGMLLPDGRLLCNLLLTGNQTLRIEKIVLHLPDGRSISAAFVGSLKDWGGVVIAPEEKLPGTGLVPPAAEIAALCDQAAISVFTQNFGNVLKLHLVPTVLDQFSLGFENMVLADPLNYDPEKCLLLDSAGNLLQYSFERRGIIKEYDRNIHPLSGRYVAELLAAKEPFDLQNVPKSAGPASHYAWLGIEMQGLTAQLARVYNVAGHTKDGRIGVLLNKVMPNSPAAKAGLQAGDILLYIRTADGESRTDLDSRYSDAPDGFDADFPWDHYDRLPEQYFSMMPPPWPSVITSFIDLLTTIGVGKDAIFGRISKGKLSEITIRLEEIPTYFAVAPRYNAKEFGLTIAEPTFEVRDYFRMESNAPGLVISNIIPGSIASVNGLKPYEIILSVDNQPMHKLQDFKEAIRDKASFSLQIRRLTTNRIVKMQTQTTTTAAP